MPENRAGIIDQKAEFSTPDGVEKRIGARIKTESSFAGLRIRVREGPSSVSASFIISGMQVPR